MRVIKLLFTALILWLSINILGCTEEVMPLNKGAVSGRVCDAQQRSVAGATITSHRSLITAETDSNGMYSLTSLDIGSHKLSVERDGFYLGSATVNIAAGESIENVNITVKAIEKTINHEPSVIQQTKAVITVECFEPMAISLSWCEVGSSLINRPATEPETFHRLEINNLFAGKEYKYFVTGKTADGRIFSAPEGHFKTLNSGGLPGNPEEPCDVTAAQSSRGPKIQWNYIGQERLKGFRVFRAVDDSELELYKNEEFIFGNERSFVDEDSRPGHVTKYAVASVDLDGNPSTLSEPCVIVPGGTLGDNIVWKASMSPIRIDSDIVIPEFYSLTVEPGVTVAFNSVDNGNSGYDRNKCEMNIKGCLYAVGTEEKPINFISMASLPSRTDWNGIRIVKSEHQVTSVFEYVTVAGAKCGIDFSETGAQLSNVSVRYCETGIMMKGSRDKFLTDINAEECGRGFYALSTSKCSLKGFKASKCDIGAELAGNKKFTLTEFDLRNIRNKGITTAEKESPTVKNGVINCQDIGLEIGSSAGIFEFLTIDALNGVVICSGTEPTLKNSIVVNMNYKGRGVGIEDMTLGHSYPYNNIYGFKTAVLNCSQSGAPVINQDPEFIGGNRTDFNYGLKGSSPLLYVSDTGSQIGAYGN